MLMILLHKINFYNNANSNRTHTDQIAIIMHQHVDSARHRGIAWWFIKLWPFQRVVIVMGKVFIYLHHAESEFDF